MTDQSNQIRFLRNLSEQLRELCDRAKDIETRDALEVLAITVEIRADKLEEKLNKPSMSDFFNQIAASGRGEL